MKYQDWYIYNKNTEIILPDITIPAQYDIVVLTVNQSSIFPNYWYLLQPISSFIVLTKEPFDFLDDTVSDTSIWKYQLVLSLLNAAKIHFIYTPTIKVQPKKKINYILSANVEYLLQQQRFLEIPNIIDLYYKPMSMYILGLNNFAKQILENMNISWDIQTQNKMFINNLQFIFNVEFKNKISQKYCKTVPPQEWMRFMQLNDINKISQLLISGGLLV